MPLLQTYQFFPSLPYSSYLRHFSTKILFGDLRKGMGTEIRKYTLSSNRKASDYLFMKDSQKQYTRNDVDILLKKYLQLANLPSINIHGLRHTFATLMADQGSPIDIIRS
ncbi:tyrosine-type recombinase/integrase [Lysinibacillus agricola]|uniref:tyrosine-type recombinase/integrase n=1 Tax=Lysinibacillus agricola TaxID=2590012 RepID=UPI003C264CE8